MAATKPNYSSLTALTTAALALPGITPDTMAAIPQESPEAGFLYSHYQESDDRVKVEVYHGSGTLPLGGRLDLSTNWVQDTWSGATPVLSVPSSLPQAVSGATEILLGEGRPSNFDAEPVQILSAATPRETRRQIDLSANYYFDEITVGLTGGYSWEPDYVSHFFNLDFQWELNQKLTTLTLGLGYTSDDIEPTTRNLQKDKSDRQMQLGITQILTKHSLMTTQLSYTHRSGFLSNPYKKVFILGLEDPNELESDGVEHVFFEKRPAKRHQWTLANRYVRHFDPWDSALHLSYRFYIDSWDLTSHTFEASWRQPLGNGWRLTPRIRYYTQSEAQFYDAFFIEPRSDGNYSSDFRLSSFGAISTGMNLSKEFFNQLQLQVGFEYYTHQANLKLGGQSETDFADFSYTLFNIGIHFEF